MNAEQAKKLRAKFPPAAIGKLPKPTKKDNPKGRCQECGGYHGLPAVHLDYVGHAAITDRLLDVDPNWTWEPMATGPNGEPLLTNGGMWIKLTVCGVTRPGFGDETNGKGMKEVIGDALRNAAMRFGVGLDLWSKENLQADEDPVPSAGVGATPVRDEGGDDPALFPPPSDAELDLLALGHEYSKLNSGFDVAKLAAWIDSKRELPSFEAELGKALVKYRQEIAERKAGA